MTGECACHFSFAYSSVFQTVLPAFPRRLLLTWALGLVLLCAGLGGGAWYAVRCDMHDYLGQAKASETHPRERYFFACGAVWRSLDGGQTWQRLPVNRPLSSVREAHLAVDRKPGVLYLAAMLSLPTSWACPLCAWTRVQPTLYVSTDGGDHWSPVYQFKPGLARSTRFVALHADPDYGEAAWVIIQQGDYVAYYGTNTAGQVWQRTCVEESTDSVDCDPPETLLDYRFKRNHPGGDDDVR